MVELVHGLHHRSPKVVELVHGLHHGCLGGDDGCPVVVKLVMGLHRGSPMVAKLEVGLPQGGYIKRHEVFRGGEASVGLHHQRYKKVKFMMELHHGSSKECGASVGASSHGFPHPCEPVSGRLHKWD